MHLTDEMFSAMKEETKTVEVRLFDDESKLVDIGDYIEFFRNNEDKNGIKMRVIDLRIQQTFKELFERDIDLLHTELYFTPKQLGAPEQSTIESLVNGMYKYYTKEQEKKYGVIAFTLERAYISIKTF